MTKSLSQRIVWPTAGKYVVAVSGGVDSAALLDILVKSKKYELVVAHFDHAMRSDSKADSLFVAKLAEKYNLAFFSSRAKDGSLKNEEQARNARYQFLQKIKTKEKANGVITAQHADDLVETLILNIGRGAGGYGLAPFTQQKVLRPLRNLAKDEIVKYAQHLELEWREDSTNINNAIARNFIRNRLLPALITLNPKLRRQILNELVYVEKSLSQKKQLISNMYEKKVFKALNSVRLKRSTVLTITQAELMVLITEVLREVGHYDMTSNQLTRIEHFIKTARDGKKHKVSGQLTIASLPNHLEFIRYNV